MPKIEINMLVNAGVKTCFDLARNIDFHKESLKHSNEKAVAGKTSGLIELGEWVTWEATHFGVKQQLTSKITVFESPNYFVDEMVSGAFKSFRHEHYFQKIGNTTKITDVFSFESPYGLLGKLANWLFLKKYMTNLLITRNTFLKEQAESV
ncbi:SRPBCC family protein [Mariniflexile sp. AS56]|uniref:SRPBCC family protein n=1 Tax=Mariniflexile sp. AS56 TaxID=3063957 RepID=UPI0026EEEB2D|nr:SRPBCC family protein [Mariniflexile sp. AS56]MDO7172802.1 SRPBCC family protein [Mariniflexile sp. AS56]